MSEVFDVKATDKGVKVDRGTKFRPEGNDYDPSEYVQGQRSDQRHIELAATRLNDRINELNKKLNSATGSLLEMGSTDRQEAEILKEAVQKKLNSLGSNFMTELGRVELSGGEMGNISYDIDKSELIGTLLREPLDSFIENELPTLIVAAEKSDGDRQEFATAMMTPEEKKKADIDRRAQRASSGLASTFGSGNVFTSHADTADKIPGKN